MRPRFDHELFARRVQAELTNSGWTRRELATRTELDETTLSRLLNRVTDPTLDTVLALCSFYGLDPRTFFYAMPASPTTATEETQCHIAVSGSSQPPGTMDRSESTEE